MDHDQGLTRRPDAISDARIRELLGPERCNEKVPVGRRMLDAIRPTPLAEIEPLRAEVAGLRARVEAAELGNAELAVKMSEAMQRTVEKMAEAFGVLQESLAVLRQAGGDPSTN